MRFVPSRYVPAALAILVLAACQTPQQRATAECGIGAAVAAGVICRVSHNSPQTCAIVALVAGGVGAAVCFNYAGKLAKEREKLAGKEGDLDARIKYVQALNKDNAELNDNLSKRIASTRQNNDQLVAKIQQGQVAAADIAQVRAANDKDYQSAAAQVAESNKAVAELQTYKSQYKPASPEFDANLDKLRAANAASRQLLGEYLSQNARIA